MSGAILCQIKRADEPFYIETVDLRISSIEELCYYLQNNLPLIELSFFNMDLIDWIRNSLHAERLADDLHRTVRGEPEPQLITFIMPIMREAGWLNADEENELRGELRDLEDEPAALRLKKRADALTFYRKYAAAVRTYNMILKLKQTETLGPSFEGAVYHNLGVAHARLFQMREAAEYLREANERLHTMRTLRDLLFCVRAGQGEDAYAAEAEHLGVDPATRDALADEIDSIPVSEPHGSADEIIAGWIKDYERETEV